MPEELRFISRNKFKIREVEEILAMQDIKIISRCEIIEELQTANTDHLVKHKVLSAFTIIGRPLFVEHTGLYLNYLGGFPGGLTQVFWDTLKADCFSELFGNTPNPQAVAKTVVGYTDGKKIYLFEGEIEGSIAEEPRGSRDFQWDCVFIPKDYNKTFAELGDLKNKISMRRLALDRFAQFLKERPESNGEPEAY